MYSCVRVVHVHYYLSGQNVIPKKALDNGYKFEYATAGACCDELVNGTD